MEKTLIHVFIYLIASLTDDRTFTIKCPNHFKKFLTQSLNIATEKYITGWIEIELNGSTYYHIVTVHTFV